MAQTAPTAAPLLAAGGPRHRLDLAALAAHARTLAGHVVGTGARRVLLVPPDHTRRASHAGELTAALVALLDPQLEQVDVLPALGTHRALGPAEARLLFGDAIGVERLLVHRWREDVVAVGEIPAVEVDELLGRKLGLSLPVAVNRLLVDGGYDLVVALGQVVPHEVAGFGGGVKHVVIGLGGGETIQRSHFVGAVHGSRRRSAVPTRPCGSCSTVPSTASSSRAAACSSPSRSSRARRAGRSCAASSPARAGAAVRAARRSGRRSSSRAR